MNEKNTNLCYSCLLVSKVHFTQNLCTDFRMKLLAHILNVVYLLSKTQQANLANVQVVERVDQCGNCLIGQLYAMVVVHA